MASPDFSVWLRWPADSGSRSGCCPSSQRLGLVLIMLGAIQKKIAVWHTGLLGQASDGWHDDLMLVTMCLVIATTGGGRWFLLS